ncbi:MAG: UDP-glucose 4-epimerase GalE [Halioglobus sp.]
MPSNDSVLVTGAAGYIGTHACVQLIEAGYQVVALDNLSNSSIKAMHRVYELCGVSFPFYQIDLRDAGKVKACLHEHDISAVLHFAGLKSVAESVEQPLAYYQNNVVGSINLLMAMKAVGVRKIVFSSTATVYGLPDKSPVNEQAAIRPVNPYGVTKNVVEGVLRDLCASDASWRASSLRYFNPIGAHPTGLIGESPRGRPNNLMPYITQVASGQREALAIYGDDYNTPDGTGVRDYIHVQDLVGAHLKGLLFLGSTTGYSVFNLGTGSGQSVLDVVKAFEDATGISIAYKIVERRPGDVDEYYADPSLAKADLQWQASLGLEEMCRDSWAWQKANPKSFE